MKVAVRRTISADHPSLPGHFPGQPIVPGVVILDEVLHALLHSIGSARLISIPTVKFLRPLQPQQPFAISFSTNDNGAVDFVCRADEQVIAQGRFLIATT